MRFLTILSRFCALALFCLCCASVASAQQDGRPFGWACSSSATSGDDYMLTGGGEGKRITLTTTGDDMRKEITNAVKKYDVVILDGSKGDFVISSSITLSNLQNKTIVGINGARICTQFYITPEIHQMLVDAGTLEASTSSGTGGTLQVGDEAIKISEECEFLCRSTIYKAWGNEDYRESGIFKFSHCENFIIRNLKLAGPGSIDVSGNDVLSVIACKHVWIDHCDLTDGMDGNLDITQGSDFITVSWCTFSYTERAFIHQNTNLVGHSDNSKMDDNLLHVTYAYNVWGQGCRARMPMVRFGTVHLLNNYYNCKGNLTPCINARKNSSLLIEGNYFEKEVTRIFAQKDATAWVWDKSNKVNEKFEPSSQGQIAIPYKYIREKADKLPVILTGDRGAGATLGDPLSCNDTVRYEVLKSMPAYYEQLRSQLTYPMAWQNAGIRKFNVWRAKARQTVFDLMGNLPPAPKNYDMKVVDAEQREGYTAYKIEFNISEWTRIPAYLLVPGKPSDNLLLTPNSSHLTYPAIVALHDHGAHFSIGKEKMVRPFKVSSATLEDALSWAEKNYDGVFYGDYLASQGFVVLAIDALFWGERGRKEGVDYDAQQALASNFLQMGTSWGAIINVEDIRSAEFLASLPFVDAKRVGCCGHSMGGYRSWMLAALTDVISASANICWMNDTEHLMTLTNNQNRGGSAYSMLIPGLRNYLDYADVAAIACPKPTLFFNGTRDKLFPVEGVEKAYQSMQKVWNGQKANDHLVTKIWDEKHFFNKQQQKEVLDFFTQHLK